MLDSYTCYMPGLLACWPDVRALCTPLAGNGKLLSIMRVNNDMLCDLAAIVEFDDSGLVPAMPQPEGQQQQQQQQQEAAQKGQLQGRFLRYTFVPGLGVGHPAILYDEVRTVACAFGAQRFGWLGAWENSLQGRQQPCAIASQFALLPS